MRLPLHLVPCALLLVLSVVTVSTLGFSSQAGPSVASANQYQATQLPGHVVPISYFLSMFTNFSAFPLLQNGNAEGNLTIEAEARQDVGSIIMHCGQNIELDTIAVMELKSGADLFVNYSVLTNNRIEINLQRRLLPTEKYNITFTRFNVFYFLDSSSGIIVKSYDEEEEKEEEEEKKDGSALQYMLTTQMQPESTRLVFPSFDEPQYKIEFHFTLTTNGHFNMLSNMPQQRCITYEDSEQQKWKMCKFMKSLKMSLYNVAFAIVSFGFVEKIDNKKRKFRIWARDSQISRVEFALNKTVEYFQLIEKEFNIDFPLDKVDSLAVPRLRAFLGMEHYGLITYSEYVLIYTKDYPMSFAKFFCMHIIAHEVAHQWFGNLVTNFNWRDIWLHEGFSTYYAYKITSDLLRSEEHYFLEKFRLIDYVRNMEDYYNTKFSTIMNPIKRTAIEKFDYLSYKKGALMVDMLENLLGQSKLKNAMTKYLKQNSYALVNANSLWSILKDYSPLDIEKITTDWLKKSGYPVIRVQFTNSSVVRLSQVSSLNSNNANYNITSTWNVPLFILFGNATHTTPADSQLLSTTVYNLTVSQFNYNCNWILLNVNFGAFLAVDYDEYYFERLTTQFMTNHSLIPVMNRAQIIRDFYDISKKFNRKNLVSLLKLLKYLRNETESLPIITAVKILDKLNGLIQFRHYYVGWRKYVLYILEPSFKKLLRDFQTDFLNKSAFSVESRWQLLHLSCQLRSKVCSSISTTITDRWRTGQLRSTDMDLLHEALCDWVRVDDSGEHWIELHNSTKPFDSWETVYAKYYALGCTRLAWTSERNLALMFGISANGSWLQQSAGNNFGLEYDSYPHLVSDAGDSLGRQKKTATLQSVRGLLLLSSAIHNPDYILSLYRFRKRIIRLFMGSIVSAYYCPAPESVVEYLLPTLSHYRYMRYLGSTSRREIIEKVFRNAEINIDWITTNRNISLFLAEQTFGL